MSFDNNPLDDNSDPHGECRHEIHRLEEEVKFLTAKISAVHDLLHKGQINEAHEACHCMELNASHNFPQTNITADQATRLHEFSVMFNHVAQEKDLMVCWVAFIPSATKQGYTSIQIGGNVDAIQQTKIMMGMKPTIAVGDHKDAVPRVGRNDPCPCKSGKKYKNCHGA